MYEGKVEMMGERRVECKGNGKAVRGDSESGCMETRLWIVVMVMGYRGGYRGDVMVVVDRCGSGVKREDVRGACSW